MLARELRHTDETIFETLLHKRSSRRRLFDIAERKATPSCYVERGGWMWWFLFTALLFATLAHAQSQPDSSTMPVAGDLVSPNERQNKSNVPLDPDWFAILVRELNVRGDLDHSLIAQLLIRSEPDKQSQ